MTKITKSNLGFTLIEVLIAVGVLAVGTLAFLPSFSGANKQKNLAQSVENAKDAIATARTRALTETGNPGESNPYEYSGIRFTENSQTYEVFRSKVADVTTCINIPTVGTSVSDGVRTFPGGVVARIAPIDSPTCMFFKFGTGEAYIAKGTTVATADACND